MSPNRRLLLAVLLAPLAAIPVSCLWAGLLLMLDNDTPLLQVLSLVLYLGLISSYALMLFFGLPVFLLLRWLGRRGFFWHFLPAVVPFLLLFLLDMTRQFMGQEQVEHHGLLFSFILIVYAAAVSALGWWIALWRRPSA